MPDANHGRSALHLIDTGGPGGAETVCLELAAGLRRRGWHCTVVVPREDWLAESLRERHFEPLILESARSFDFGYLAELRRIAVEGGFDLVQTHLLGTSVYGTLATTGTGLPVVSTFHGVPDIKKDDRFRGLKTKILGGARNHSVFVSQFLQDEFRSQRLFDPDRAHVIPNGIDCELFAPGASDVRAELGIAEGVPLVGAVGNMRRAKAYDVLLRAFVDVSTALPQARLVIAGRGGNDVEARWRALSTDLGLDGRVVFAGFWHDVPALMRALDVYALSSSDEGFSLTTVQAMATGLPVVATRCGGPETIIADPTQGVLVENGRPEALAGALIDVLRDPIRATAMGEAARSRVIDAYSIDAMVDSYDALYAQLVPVVAPT